MLGRYLFTAVNLPQPWGRAGQQGVDGGKQIRSDPLDTAYSQGRPGNQWNTWEFPALYCCRCERVARAVTLEVLRLAGAELDDLQVSYWPQLVEVMWSGRVVDKVSAQGVAAAGLPASHPWEVSKSQTQDLDWFRQPRRALLDKRAGQGGREALQAKKGRTQRT